MVLVHAETHRTARLAPLEAGVLEYLVEALRLRGGLDALTAGDDHRADAVGDLSALHDLRRAAEVGHAGVGTRPEEGHVDFVALHRLAGRDAHVLLCHPGGVLLFFGQVLRGRNRLGDADALSGRGPPRHDGFEFGAVDGDDVVVLGVLVGADGLPVRLEFVEPLRVLLEVLGLFQPVVGGLVGVDVARASAALDGHVTDAHPALHVEVLDGLAGVLVDVADAAFGPEAADDFEDDVLGLDAGSEFARDLDFPHLLFLHRDRLGRQHVANLARPDTERERAERAVGRGVAVAADDSHAGLGESLLGPDDVDDALLARGGVREVDARVADVLFEFGHHLFGGVVAERPRLVRRGDDVVDRRVRPVRVGDFEVALLQHAERLWARHLVDEVQAAEQLGLAGRKLRDRVFLPDLVVQRSLTHGRHPIRRRRRGRVPRPGSRPRRCGACGPRRPSSPSRSRPSSRASRRSDRRR
ncbi:Flp pilus assembly protein TadG [Haloferax denitrificans ATCC 35960]|uniref:Flp pilus assembly protein TadG n=1 Tax=Haloferax denitrificans ATCC 35960 TaxID=662478 RepID=M0IWW1_9EURY|nr:Flp pilus assembly protein TadG [Haloferax denitrificans ATCC 35960]